MTITHENNLFTFCDLPNGPQDVAATGHLASGSYVSLDTARSVHSEEGSYVSVIGRVATANRSRGTYVSGAIASAASGGYISR